MDPFLNVTLGGLLGSGVTTAVLGAVLLRRNKNVEADIKSHFDKRLKVFETTRVWQEQALAELFGPLQMQFVRTKRAFSRWTTKNLYLEAKIVRDGNAKALDILLSKGHLIPPQLMNHASDLVEHYDVWLEAFDRQRGNLEVTEVATNFVFVGPAGYPFPTSAEDAFTVEFHRLQKELYSV